MMAGMTDRKPPRPDIARSGVDREKIWRAASRPAWSIRSRRGALAPFLAMLRELFRRKR